MHRLNFQCLHYQWLPVRHLTKLCLSFLTYKTGRNRLHWEVCGRMFPALEPSLLCSSSQVYYAFTCKLWHDVISKGKRDIKGPLKHIKDPTGGIKGTCSTKVRLNWKQYTPCVESNREICLVLDAGRETDFRSNDIWMCSRIRNQVWAPKLGDNRTFASIVQGASVPGRDTSRVGALAYFTQTAPPRYLCPVIDSVRKSWSGLFPWRNFHLTLSSIHRELQRPQVLFCTWGARGICPPAIYR